MEQNNQKIMTVAFVVTAFVVGIVVDVLFVALATSFGAVANFRSTDLVRHGLPIAFGVITFLSLQLNPKVKAWADEVLVELLKVVWPTKNDVVAMTTVVCVMLIISGIVLGTFDFISGQVIKVLLN